MYKLSDLKLWMIYIFSIILLNVFFVGAIRVYFVSAEELSIASAPQLDNYSSVDQVKAAYERLISECKEYKSYNEEWYENSNLRYGILISKFRILLNDSPLNSLFHHDKDYANLLKYTSQAIDEIGEVIEQLYIGQLSKEKAIEIIESKRKVISLLDKRAYELQIYQYDKTLQALEKSQKIYFVFGLVIFWLVAIIGAVFLGMSLRYRRIAKEKQEAIQRKNLFFAAFKHEMSTPLQSLVGAVDLLSEMANSTEDKEFIAQLQSSAQLIIAQMKDLGEYSRLDAGGLAIRNKKFVIQELVDEINVLFNSKIHEKGIKFILCCDIACEKIEADYDRIKQIIVNLLSNSIKFTAQGFVKLDIKFDLNNTILIVVEDSGIGINSKNLGIIFEPFKQINSDYPNKGMGLGLTIVKYVVKLLNGNIEVKSSEGKGTSFFVFIPVKRVS